MLGNTGMVEYGRYNANWDVVELVIQLFITART